MLVLGRKQSQAIVIDGAIRVTVLKVNRNVVRLGIDAPKHVCILREELILGGDEDPQVANEMGVVALECDNLAKVRAGS